MTAESKSVKEKGRLRHKHQGTSSKQRGEQKPRIRRFSCTTSRGRYGSGASAGASRSHKIRWIVWIAHFSAGVERARGVRGERPLYATKNVCEEGRILIDGVSTNCTRTRVGRRRGKKRVDQPARLRSGGRDWNTNSGPQVRLWGLPRRVFLGTMLPNES